MRIPGQRCQSECSVLLLRFFSSYFCSWKRKRFGSFTKSRDLVDFETVSELKQHEQAARITCVIRLKCIIWICLIAISIHVPFCQCTNLSESFLFFMKRTKKKRQNRNCISLLFCFSSILAEISGIWKEGWKERWKDCWKMGAKRGLNKRSN